MAVSSIRLPDGQSLSQIGVFGQHTVEFPRAEAYLPAGAIFTVGFRLQRAANPQAQNNAKPVLPDRHSLST